MRMPNGRRRDLGLGSFPDVGLAEARQRASDYRRMVRDGLDPLDERRKARRRAITFQEVAEDCWESRKKEFKNGKHVDQWINTLKAYVFPAIGQKPIGEVTHAEVTAALRPVWQEKKETARRVLQRVCDVCSYAVGLGLRESELPRKVIRDALGKQRKKVEHFAAVPVEDAPRVYQELYKKGTRASEALRFQILTALRPGIGRAALWEEIDWEHGIWTIPAARMKTDEEHKVPLSVSAIQILQTVKAIPADDELDTPFVFPSPTKPKKQPISDTSLNKVQKEIVEGVTLHGWRSTFEDWAAEYTDFPEHVIDAAMAHALDDEVKAAYRRTAFLDQRLVLMQQWDDFLEGKTPIKQGLDAAHRASKRKAT